MGVVKNGEEVTFLRIWTVEGTAVASPPAA